MDATTTRASMVSRSMPTSDTRTHASITMPLSSTWSRTSMTRDRDTGEECSRILEFAMHSDLQERNFEIAVNERDLLDACHIEDRHQRVHRAARLYADPIKQAAKDESKADVWFALVPEEVYPTSSLLTTPAKP